MMPLPQNLCTCFCLSHALHPHPTTSSRFQLLQHFLKAFLDCSWWVKVPLVCLPSIVYFLQASLKICAFVHCLSL